MSTTTPINGWTVPSLDGSDDINKIGKLVNQGLTGIENSLTLATDSQSVAAAYSTYPIGASLMGLTTAGATAGGWPEAISGYVYTLRRPAGDASAQFHITNRTATAPAVRFRNGNSSGWSSWLVVTSAGTPTAQASGQVSGTPSTGGGTIALPVTFPAGRFSASPRVAVWINVSSLPGQSACSVDAVTSTGCTVYLYRQNATLTSVGWLAIQGVDS